MKEAKLMRKNARSRWSWEPGGDLITLTVRVAGAAVVNDVIGHCRPFDRKGVSDRVDEFRELWRVMGQTQGKPLYPFGVL
jgi:hypothetical protein